MTVEKTNFCFVLTLVGKSDPQYERERTKACLCVAIQRLLAEAAVPKRIEHFISCPRMNLKIRA